MGPARSRVIIGRADHDGGEHHDARDREREPPERATDPRDVFLADLDLPRAQGRELVLEGRDRYELSRDDVRALATVGAFRVVPERHVSDRHEKDVTHLRDQGLVRSVSVNARDRVVTLTDRGRRLLENHRRDRQDGRQQGFYAGVSRMRELSHDSKLYAAYVRQANRLREEGAHVHRVVLDIELKREYQQWLQDHNRGRSDRDGRPDREPGEIEQWAREHDLPYFDGSVQFPDFRIEYELDHVQQHHDVEVVTANYRGAHAASRARSGFTCVGGRSRGGGDPFDPECRGGFRMSGVSLPDLRNSVSEERVKAVQAFGFTERQVRFLVHVLVHSGVFLERQYRASARIAHGQKTHDFLAKLVGRGYAKMITPGAVHRGRLYHVRFKPLYRAIGEPDNRHRKPAQLGRFVERLMVLDAVIDDDSCTWLGTERDKRNHFILAHPSGLEGSKNTICRGSSSGRAMRRRSVTSRTSCRSASHAKASDTCSCT
jgi:hypothetical protein